MDVANFETRTLTIQTAWPESRQSPFMGQLRKRVGLIHHLRQLTSTEEVFDGSADALWIDQRPRGHVLNFLETHALLNGPTQLQKAFSQLFASQFVNRSQSSIAQVVDVIETSIGFTIE